MNVQMIGIDFTKAEINIRERFAFTKKEIAKAMELLKLKQEIYGCVILSTCNRMEMWFSLRGGTQPELLELLCELKGLDIGDYKEYLAVRRGMQAVEHLFFLCSGMKSQIIGEDQILTQVKEALSFAREWECTDYVLEMLFRRAITAGKLVKTKVPMDKANFSAAHKAVQFLKEQGDLSAGKKCLVIGNGEMGKLTANALMEEGASVMMTVRQYKSGIVNIPKGVGRINYGERYQYIPECEIVFSATSSPNITITKADLEQCYAGKDRKNQIFVDLAVPRDIEPSVRSMEHVRCYDLDSFHMDTWSKEMHNQFHQAEQILKTEIQKFTVWMECRDLVPRIINIGEESAKEMVWRMERPLKNLSASEEEKDRFRHQMEQTAGKVVDKLLFVLRDQTDKELLRQVVEVLEKVYQA